MTIQGECAYHHYHHHLLYHHSCGLDLGCIRCLICINAWHWHGLGTREPKSIGSALLSLFVMGWATTVFALDTYFMDGRTDGRAG